MLNGLIFDVDGVIADSEAVNAKASIKVFAELFGIKHVQRKDFEAGLGRGAEAYMKAAAQVHGISLNAEQLKLATAARQDNFLTILEKESLKPYPGVLELMHTALNHKNFRLAIATSSTRAKSEAVLQSANIPYKQMRYITGDDVKNKKPNPELFLVAAQALKISAYNCVVIEDAPNGVQAAKAAGCKCIAVTNTSSPEKLSQADLIVNTLTQINLRDIVDLISGP
jgi:HAD superfamily hydrolase (TIGR01509 family)